MLLIKFKSQIRLGIFYRVVLLNLRKQTKQGCVLTGFGVVVVVDFGVVVVVELVSCSVEFPAT